MKKIICIGSVTRDIFISLKETKIIDTPEDLTSKQLMGFEFGAKIYADDFREEVGGSAVNIGFGMLLCGIKPFVFSRTSKSESGKWILKQIGKMKLKKNYMQRNGRKESETSVILTDKKHKDHVIFRTGDSVELFDVKKALKKFREKVDLIYVGSQKTGWNENFLAIIEFAGNKKAPVAFNPSSYQIENDAEKIVKFLSGVKVLLVNKDEAIELVRNVNGKASNDVAYLSNQLLGKGCEIVVITDGSRGAYAADDKDLFHIPTKTVKVVDTVGAGDAFASGFLSSLLKDNDLKMSLVWGVVNSAGAVSKCGATKGLLTEKELRNAGKKHLGSISKLR
ncbi:MAG: carbohydrate kinase family protein [Patescibacteria group bacterium]|nr:carbohydrate kinase family protein [Patescibacteria group bacterium]